MSKPPQKPPLQQARRAGWATVASATGAMIIITLLLMLLPGMIGIAIAIGMWMLLGLLLFHYLVWGWWLSKIIQADEPSEDSAGQ
ncbi:MAG: hypothetical protein CMJ75_05850 [Planctomycetaceae bacterium]|nr:hypothetical protein [Planctomycetaceae bacterium]